MIKLLDENWVKFGFTPSGYQRYRNKITKEVYTHNPNRISIEKKYMSIRMYYKGMSLRSCSEMVGVSHGTVYNWVVKFGKLIEEAEGLNVDTDKVYDDVEIDEMWHYCKKKVKKRGFS